jgi:hypothetical protein
MKSITYKNVTSKNVWRARVVSQCQIKDLFAPGFILVTYLETLLQNIFDLILFFLCVLTPLSAIWRPVLVVEEAGVPAENHRLWC